ncbi:hypothetical protein [Methylomonas koyamae]|uniref:hypothetical protein n=1 Tax=Methylomonas koyamae TaxID=702114 RepID=UPI001C341D53|nr:hypothetical protein [Methylomonas koyamae]BBL60080.1 hypothetical protein MKFW12EY_36930 [Methylomonas koyamae]
MAKHPKRSTDNRSFSAKPHHIFRPNFAAGTPSPAAVLSHKAAHLLDNLTAQYNGKNNGDLSAAPKIMELFGWKSRGSIDESLTELLAFGFIEQTRQGGRNQCSLYAITWQPIDECGGKLDVKSTIVASNLWKPENAEKRDKRFVNKWEAMRKKSK